MAGLISTLFFVFLCAFFYSVGLPFRRILKDFEWERSIIVTSTCGLALTSLAVTLGYRFGLLPQLMFWLLIGLGLFCLRSTPSLAGDIRSVRCSNVKDLML